MGLLLDDLSREEKSLRWFIVVKLTQTHIKIEIKTVWTWFLSIFKCFEPMFSELKIGQNDPSQPLLVENSTYFYFFLWKFSLATLYDCISHWNEFNYSVTVHIYSLAKWTICIVLLPFAHYFKFLFLFMKIKQGMLLDFDGVTPSDR